MTDYETDSDYEMVNNYSPPDSPIPNPPSTPEKRDIRAEFRERILSNRIKYFDSEEEKFSISEYTIYQEEGARDCPSSWDFPQELRYRDDNKLPAHVFDRTVLFERLRRINQDGTFELHELIDVMNEFFFWVTFPPSGAEKTENIGFYVRNNDSRRIEIKWWDITTAKKVADVQIHVDKEEKVMSVFPLKDSKSTKTRSIFEIWRSDNRKLVCNRAIFDPTKPFGKNNKIYPELDKSNGYEEFNLWSGFPYHEPFFSCNHRQDYPDCLASTDEHEDNVGRQGAALRKKRLINGAIEMFVHHVVNVLSSNNPNIASLIFSWLVAVRCEQKRKTEILLGLLGKGGAGKSIFFSAFLKLFGDHGLGCDAQFHDRFFGPNLCNKIFVFVDEFQKLPEDKEQQFQSNLKNLITGSHFCPNQKHRSIRVQEPNYLNIGIASNRLDCVPFDPDDINRRYALIEVSDSEVINQSKNQNSDYFRRFADYFIRESPERDVCLRALDSFLVFCHLYDIFPFDPSDRPLTSLCVKHMINTLSPAKKWWRGLLLREYNGFESGLPGDRDPKTPTWAVKFRFECAFKAWDDHRISTKVKGDVVTEEEFCVFFNLMTMKEGGTAKEFKYSEKTRSDVVEVPPLQELKEIFCRVTSLPADSFDITTKEAKRITAPKRTFAQIHEEQQQKKSPFPPPKKKKAPPKVDKRQPKILSMFGTNN